jgi:CRP-like cAMP-binding protein
LWLPFKWNCLFIAINSYRIGKVFLDRYLAEQLSEELLQTRKKHFNLMDPVDFAQLARLGKIETYNKGDLLVKQGDQNSYVRFVLSGSLKVMHDDTLTYLLSEGNFVSESGLHAGLMLPDSVESCCSVEARSPVRVLSWDRTELVDLLNRAPDVKRSVKAILSWDIVRKLKAQRSLLSQHVIEDPEAWTQKRSEQTEYRYASILKNLLATHDKKEMVKRKQELNKYRTIHHIDDYHHRMAVEACGWTLEEFEAGCKKDQQPNQQIKKRHGPEWYVREMIHRLVG